MWRRARNSPSNSSRTCRRTASRHLRMRCRIRRANLRAACLMWRPLPAPFATFFRLGLCGCGGCWAHPATAPLSTLSWPLPALLIQEEEIMGFDPCTPIIINLITSLQALFDEVKVVLLSDAYDTFVSACCEELSSALEHVLAQTSFTRYGGLQFDKDVRYLIGCLSTNTQWVIRDKFVRLTQIATLLNLEQLSELSEYWGSGSTITWRLTPAEARKVLALRVDFKADEVNKIRL
eukprot:m.678045 g.678045  ORF g.678045 m.678045 type:complete len:235 (-) comp58577_c0_seq15:62-766(-)